MFYLGGGKNKAKQLQKSEYSTVHVFCSADGEGISLQGKHLLLSGWVPSLCAEIIELFIAEDGFVSEILKYF